MTKLIKRKNSKRCAICKTIFHKRITESKKAWKAHKYCSVTCGNIAKRKLQEDQKYKICPVCKKEFRKLNSISVEQWHKQIHCGNKCAGIKVPIEEYKKQRLSYYFSKTVTTESGCMEWQGFTDIHGYGKALFLKKKENLHRIVWKLTNGSIPEGLFVCHSCDNRKCVNPDHLFLGTNLDNIEDMVSKGRQSKWKTFLPILSNQDKELIWKMLIEGYKPKAVAQEFGVCLRTIQSVPMLSQMNTP